MFCPACSSNHASLGECPDVNARRSLAAVLGEVVPPTYEQLMAAYMAQQAKQGVSA